MKPVPHNPTKLQSRIMSALVGDILDPEAKGFDRLDALRSSMIANRDGVCTVPDNQPK